MCIRDRQGVYCKQVEESLKNKGFRAISDLRNEKIGFKIREHNMQKVPYLLVAGDREMENGQISVRTQDGRDLGVMSIEDFVAHISTDVAQLGRTKESQDH